MSMALVSLYALRDETVGLIVDQHRVRPKAIRMPIERGEIREAAATLAELFSSSRMYAASPEVTTDMKWAGPLAGRLLGPLVHALPKVKHVVMSLHADLHWLPPHMLDVDGLPLAARFGVSYVPNLSLYGALVRREHTQARSGHETSINTRGSVAFTTAADEDPETVHSAFSIPAERFAKRIGATHLQGIAASKKAVIEALGSAEVVYLGCHGVFQSHDPLGSALLLSDGQRLPSRFPSIEPHCSLTVRDVLGIEVRAKLVILSACLSGRQAFAAGDEPLGFPAAFLLGGSSSVLAANWNAEWVATGAFMMHVLDRWLGSEQTIGEAVWSAHRLSMRDRPHPFHWAAFSLHGNDRLRFRTSGL